MRSNISSPSRPLFCCALLSAVAVSACSTEQVSPDPTKVIFVAVASPEYNSAAGLFVIRDDAYDASLMPRNLAPYGVTVDGRLAAWDETFFVQAGPASALGFTLPAGSHVISLVDDQGRVAVTSPPMDTRPGFDPATSSFSPAVVFFGGPTSLRARVIFDDPALVPAGSVHVRLMNALADHQPIQPVQCPTDVDGGTAYTAGACTPVGDPIAYGAVFEQDAAPDVAARLGYYWAAPDAVDPVVMSISRGRATAGGYVTAIPTQVQGPGHQCPSCVFTEF
jgi:hypothetical protein